ncbi:hypothetical protein HRbin11_02420 [bacterium HR11]|nr:hypothetical protein HRbin11_02420 [bacterium HR11]
MLASAPLPSTSSHAGIDRRSPAQSVRGIADDGSNVGTNPSRLVPPGGSLAAGLFGAVNVELKGAEWYRRPVTADELKMATVGYTADGHPVIDYDAPIHQTIPLRVCRLGGCRATLPLCPCRGT